MRRRRAAPDRLLQHAPYSRYFVLGVTYELYAEFREFEKVAFGYGWTPQL